MNIVQIGCNRGDDHITRLIQQGTIEVKNLVLVDALPKCIERARECYKELFPNALFYQLCMVTDDSQAVDIFHPVEERFGGDSSELTSIRHDHLTGHGVDQGQIKKITVPAQNINAFLSSLPFKLIDQLYIDTEGLDCDLIMALKPEELEKIQYISWETSHSDGAHTKGKKCEDTYAFLEKYGYTITKHQNEAEARRWT